MDKRLYRISRLTSLIFLLMLVGCTGIPEGVKPVKNVNREKYLGVWYEIARIDNWFEKDLSHVSANYTLREDKGLNVLNKGFNTKDNKWVSIKGKAYFIDNQGAGKLRVTFFWPFYSSYNIITLDKENYSYAMVCGYSKSYLWILARHKSLDKNIVNNLVEKADKLGFDTSKLIFIEQN